MKFDVIVVGGGPAGATAAEDLARSGISVAMLDRAGRIKPCGGAIPPRLRDRAVKAGAEAFEGTFLKITREDGHPRVHYRDKASGETMTLDAKLVIGADGAKSRVALAEVEGADKVPLVFAYHEIIAAPPKNEVYDPMRCDVIYLTGLLRLGVPAWKHNQRRHGNREP